ncbi:MAG: SPASM domain-containing protein, partial [Bacteroidales bacterium]|nr:SPASM domain-containing protein [Bacteroidales bacterium]
FFKVIRTITLMQQKQVEFNTLSVVSNICEGKGVEIYNFFKSIGSRYMQFIPALDRYRAHNMNHENDTGYEHDIDAIKYGEFLIDIFNEWKKEDIGEYYVTVFDAVLARWCNITPRSCVFADRCNGGLTIEHNGDVFSCDHFVYPKNLLGNINDTNLKDIFHSNNNFEFGLKKRYNLSSECLSCKYLNICLGDCPKNRKPADKGSQFLPSGLCAGLKLFFSHTESFMKQMRDDILRH